MKHENPIAKLAISNQISEAYRKMNIIKLAVSNE
jgi:hypothetical protein